jgi:FkbM family methyltransferase
MAPQHWLIFQTRRKQVGLWRAARLTLLKVLRIALCRGVQFHFGNTAEDILIASLAENYLGRKEFTYVDVGCHEPRRISNSYLAYLGGSSGLAVDLNPGYATAFKRERPNDIFVCAAVSDHSGETVAHEYTAAEVATIDPVQADLWQKQFRPTGTRVVTTTTLREVLDKHMPGRTIDVLLIDVEGHELAVLRGAGLPTLAPGIIACEMHGRAVAEAFAHPVTAFLQSHEYVLVAYAASSAYFVRSTLLKMHH